jgi:hypothetical protein
VRRPPCPSSRRAPRASCASPRRPTSATPCWRSGGPLRRPLSGGFPRSTRG